RSAFPLIRSHVLLSVAGDLATADADSAELLSGDVIAEVVASVPDDLLMDPEAGSGDFSSADAARARYAEYLTGRLAARTIWLAAALAAQEQLRIEAPQHLKARR
ncbi:MAG: hypothetical protein ABI969_14185, partial [bacterium]